jgi:hypothetical protein
MRVSGRGHTDGVEGQEPHDAAGASDEAQAANAGTVARGSSGLSARAGMTGGAKRTDESSKTLSPAEWTAKVKDFVASEVEQGELDNDLATVDAKDLPASVAKELAKETKKWGDNAAVQAYKVDQVGGRTAYLVAAQAEEHTGLTLFDDQGKKLGSGSWDAEDTFHWD